MVLFFVNSMSHHDRVKKIYAFRIKADAVHAVAFLLRYQTAVLIQKRQLGMCFAGIASAFLISSPLPNIFYYILSVSKSIHKPERTSWVSLSEKKINFDIIT